MTVDDSHPELFPEEAGTEPGMLPPFEELFDAPELSLELLESLISVAVDPTTPDPGVDLIPEEVPDPGMTSDPVEDDPWELGETDEDQILPDSGDPLGDPALDLDQPVEDDFPGEDPLAGL